MCVEHVRQFRKIRTYSIYKQSQERILATIQRKMKMKQSLKSLITIRAKLAEWTMRYGELDPDKIIDKADYSLIMLQADLTDPKKIKIT